MKAHRIRAVWGARIPAGALLAPVLLAGCHGIGNINIIGPLPPTPTTPVTTNPAVVAKSVYYCSPGFNSLYLFAANQSGTVTATDTIAVAGTGPVAVTGDAAGTLYVASNTVDSGEVQAIAAGANAFGRTIQLPEPPAMQYNQISTMTTDTAGNLYVATGGGTIFIYAPDASGTATPLRTLTGVTVPMAGGPTQMAVDAAGNLYVAEGGGYVGTQLVEFGPTATGSAVPEVLTPSTYLPIGVALDTKGNIYISQSGVNPVTLSYRSAIYEFAAGAKSGDTPIRSIVGSDTQLGFHLADLQIDAAGNIFLEQYVGLVSVFGANANGNVAPASTLTIKNSYSTDTQFFLR
jgi:hypothetical protein